MFATNRTIKKQNSFFVNAPGEEPTCGCCTHSRRPSIPECPSSLLSPCSASRLPPHSSYGEKRARTVLLDIFFRLQVGGHGKAAIEPFLVHLANK